MEPWGKGVDVGQGVDAVRVLPAVCRGQQAALGLVRG